MILERRRAEEIYTEAKAQIIDPGLLQQGERDIDEARRTTVFSAHIMPIPAFGTKRVEMEYQERIPVEQMQSLFALPLTARCVSRDNRRAVAHRYRVALAPCAECFESVGKLYPLTVRERTPNRVKADFTGERVTLNEDFALQYTLDPAKRDTLAVLTYRDGGSEPGFFEASALIGDSWLTASGSPPDNCCVVRHLLIDAMGEAGAQLRGSREITSKSPPCRPISSVVVQFRGDSVLAASRRPESVDKALEFVRASRFVAERTCRRRWRPRFRRPIPAEIYIVVLLTDGSPTKGAEIRNAKIAGWYANKTQARTYVFAVGDDANIALLKQLAGERGVLEWVRSTEPLDFKLNVLP